VQAKENRDTLKEMRNWKEKKETTWEKWKKKVCMRLEAVFSGRNANTARNKKNR
jgi:hypothetical protein